MKSKIKQRVIQVLASVFLVTMVLLSVSGSAIPDAIAESYDANKDFGARNISEFRDLYNRALKGNNLFDERFGGSNKINIQSTKILMRNARTRKYETIDLTKRVELEDSELEKGQLPYKYYIWFKVNKQRVSSRHWHTEYFIGTSKKVGGTYTADLYNGKAGVISQEVARYEFDDDCVQKQKKAGGSYIFNYYNGSIRGRNAFDMYVIDMEKYIQTAWKKYKDANSDFSQGYDFSTKAYLQTVPAIYDDDANTKLLGGKYMNKATWEAGAKNNGFDSSGINQYKFHYDQVVSYQVAQEKKTETTLHWLIATAKHPNGNLKTDDSKDNFTNHPNKASEHALRREDHKDKLTIGGITKYKGIKLVDKKSVTTSSDGKGDDSTSTSTNDEQYILTGVRFARGKSGTNEVWSFYLYDKLLSPEIKASIFSHYSKDGAEGLKNVTVEKSLHSTGIERDFDTGKTHNINVENGQWKKEGLTGSKDSSREVESLKDFADKHNDFGKANSYYMMFKYVQNIMYKWEILPTDIYYIYQPIGKSGEVSITRNFYDYKPGEGWKQIDSKYTSNVDVILSGNTLSFAGFPKKFQKAEYAMGTSGNQAKYTFRSASATYTENGKNGNIQENKAANLKGSGKTVSGSDTEVTVSNGKKDDKINGDYSANVANKGDYCNYDKKFSVDDMKEHVKWSNVKISGKGARTHIVLNYYQPLSVHTKTRMLRYRTQTGSLRYTPILQTSGGWAGNTMTYQSSKATETFNTNGYFVLCGEKSRFNPKRKALIRPDVRRNWQT